MNSVNTRALKVEVDLAAIQHNLNVARRSSPQQKIFAVIKADAYGHGAVRVASALASADAFAVVTLNEAIELRDASIDKPILVLQGANSTSDYSDFVRHNLWPVIHSEEQLRMLSGVHDAAQLSSWIKIDSGMGRLGFLPVRAQALLSADSGFKWFGALTHFACADELDNPVTAQQINVFRTLQMQDNLALSMANSAGVLAWPDASADWARPGIMLYGANPVDDVSRVDVSLRLAMRVSAPLMSIKHYKAGATIGYGCSYRCPEAMSIGYAAIGYGDGMPRVFDDTAAVWIEGKVCPIVGRVSMDSIAVDLRGLEQVTHGTNVVLWGPEHSIEILAKAANTISYELMTSIKGVRQYV